MFHVCSYVHTLHLNVFYDYVQRCEYTVRCRIVLYKSDLLLLLILLQYEMQSGRWHRSERDGELLPRPSAPPGAQRQESSQCGSPPPPPSPLQNTVSDSHLGQPLKAGIKSMWLPSAAHTQFLTVTLDNP